MMTIAMHPMAMDGSMGKEVSTQAVVAQVASSLGFKQAIYHSLLHMPESLLAPAFLKPSPTGS